MTIHPLLAEQPTDTPFEPNEPRTFTVRSAKSITNVASPELPESVGVSVSTSATTSVRPPAIRAPLPNDVLWKPIVLIPIEKKIAPATTPVPSNRSNYPTTSVPQPAIPKLEILPPKPLNIQSAKPEHRLPVYEPDTRTPFDKRLDQAIDVTTKRILSTSVHTPWQIAHGVLALRQDYQIEHQGQIVNTLSWIATGPSFKDKPWFMVTPYGGKGHPFTEKYEFEGHPNQFLALFSLSRLPRDFQIQVGDKTITINDMINNAKMEVNNREEIAWTLWTLAYYDPPDTSWINNDNQRWSIEYLVRLQMSKPVTKSACGGMHGLFAIASARNAYLQTGQQLRGTWLEAHMHLRKHVEMARWGQNRDGSFSSKYFRSKGYSSDVVERLSTTGHTLEFLMVAIPEPSLDDPWIKNAAMRIASDLIENKNTELELGGMYHALHSLILYRERTRPNYADNKTELAEDKPEIQAPQQPGSPAKSIGPQRHANKPENLFRR